MSVTKSGNDSPYQEIEVLIHFIPVVATVKINTDLPIKEQLKRMVQMGELRHETPLNIIDYVEELTPYRKWEILQ